MLCKARPTGAYIEISLMSRDPRGPPKGPRGR